MQKRYKRFVERSLLRCVTYLKRSKLRFTEATRLESHQPDRSLTPAAAIPRTP